MSHIDEFKKWNAEKTDNQPMNDEANPSLAPNAVFAVVYYISVGGKNLALDGRLPFMPSPYQRIDPDGTGHEGVVEIVRYGPGKPVEVGFFPNPDEANLPAFLERGWRIEE